MNILVVHQLYVIGKAIDSLWAILAIPMRFGNYEAALSDGTRQGRSVGRQMEGWTFFLSLPETVYLANTLQLYTWILIMHPDITI